MMRLLDAKDPPLTAVCSRDETVCNVLRAPRFA
jgi:hypothetical protein